MEMRSLLLCGLVAFVVGTAFAYSSVGNVLPTGTCQVSQGETVLASQKMSERTIFQLDQSRVLYLDDNFESYLAEPESSSYTLDVWIASLADVRAAEAHSQNLLPNPSSIKKLQLTKDPQGNSVEVDGYTVTCRDYQ